MPKIYSYIETQQPTNNIGSLFNNQDNEFNTALSGLPSVENPNNPEPTDVPTDLDTDYVILTDLSTDYVILTDITTDLGTDLTITTDLDTDYVILTDLSTDYVILTDVTTDVSTDILTDVSTDILTDVSTDILTDVSTDILTDIVPPPPAIDARDYEVWAAAWGGTGLPENKSVVPMVTLMDYARVPYSCPESQYPDPPEENCPGAWLATRYWMGPTTTDTSDDYFRTYTMDRPGGVKEQLNRIPPGRRVLKPLFWLLETPTSPILAGDPWRWVKTPYFENMDIKFTYYNEGADGSLFTKNGTTYKIPTVWSDQSNIDVTESMKQFFIDMKERNIEFDYVSDSCETIGLHSIWWIGGRPEEYASWLRNHLGYYSQFHNYSEGVTFEQTVQNIVYYSGFYHPHKMEGMVEDPRWTTRTPYSFAEKTSDEIFYETYNKLHDSFNNAPRSLFLRYGDSWFVPKENNTKNALSYLYGYYHDTDPERAQRYPWGDSNAHAASRAWGTATFIWMPHFRNLMWREALDYAGYNSVELSMYSVEPLKAEEAVYLTDLNGGPWVSGSGTDYWPNKLTVAPQCYGWASNQGLGMLAHITNPSNDEEKYRFALVSGFQSWPPRFSELSITPTKFIVAADQRTVTCLYTNTNQLQPKLDDTIKIRDAEPVGMNGDWFIIQQPTSNSLKFYISGGQTVPQGEYTTSLGTALVYQPYYWDENTLPSLPNNPDTGPAYKRYYPGHAGWFAFMTDLMHIRGIIRSDYNAWQQLTPWIPAYGVGVDEGMQYGPDLLQNEKSRRHYVAGEYGPQYWEEFIYHCAIHGTKFFNVLGGSNLGDSKLHEILDKWRNISGNSRCRPITTNLIEVGTSLVISGGRLLKSGKYIWRLTAKSPSSLNRLQRVTNRTDIPQTIDIPDGSRGVWLITNTPEVPVYAITTRPVDPPPPPPPTDILYLTDLDYQYRTPNIFKMKALYGGNVDHDFGSGIGLNQGGATSGAINYLVSAGVKTQFKLYENDSLYQYTLYHDFDSSGTPSNYKIEVNLGNFVTITSSICNVGEPCYNSEPLASKWFREEMVQSGEWGPPLRSQEPYPNNESILNNCVIPYTTTSEGIKTKPEYDTSKPTDLLWDYSNDANSFWNRSTAEGGREDLAYTYFGAFKTGYDYPVWREDVLTPVTD